MLKHPSAMAGWMLLAVILFLGSCQVALARIKMGTSEYCDNAREGTEIDWDSTDSKPHTCPPGKAGTLPVPSSLLNSGKSRLQILGNFFHEPRAGDFPYPCPPSDGKQQEKYIEMSNLPNQGAHHVCMNTSISYNLPWPASGDHRPGWPMYGSYKYIPPQRYLHSLEHGAIIALYNPCATSQEIEKFKATVACTIKQWAAEKTFHTQKEEDNKDVLRFILSPEIKVPPCLPFMLMAWQNRLMLPKVEVPAMVTFIKKHYAEGPEKNGYDGQYFLGLVKPSVSSSLQKHCNLVE